MAEETLQRNLRSAFDPGLDFPSHLLLSRTMAAIAAEAPSRRRQSWRVVTPRTTSRLMAAFLIAVVILVTAGAAFAIHQFVHRPAPIPTHRYQALTCEGFSGQTAGAVPTPLKMSSPTTGWAQGALRTTDGGAHWSNVAPPSTPNRSVGEAEFFLDGSHAWVAEAAGSATACSDHIVVYGTSDAGRTWSQAAPIPVSVSAPTEIIWRPQLDFVDANNGWLLIATVQDLFPKTVGPLYRTRDGGLHWTLVSTKPAWSTNPSCVGGDSISFISSTTGWMPLQGCGSTGADSPLMFLVTHDGGSKWVPQIIVSYCGCDAGMPVFFDDKHGLVEVIGMYGPVSDQLYVTSDGGATWSGRSLPLDQVNENAVSLDFIDPLRGWLLIVSYQACPTQSICSDTQRDVYRIDRTADGGNSWTELNANVPVGGSLTFADANNGFLAASTGVYKTGDGGRSWSLISAVVS